MAYIPLWSHSQKMLVSITTQHRETAVRVAISLPEDARANGIHVPRHSSDSHYSKVAQWLTAHFGPTEDAFIYDN